MADEQIKNHNTISGLFFNIYWLFLNALKIIDILIFHIIADVFTESDFDKILEAVNHSKFMKQLVANLESKITAVEIFFNLGCWLVQGRIFFSSS